MVRAADAAGEDEARMAMMRSLNRTIDRIESLLALPTSAYIRNLIAACVAETQPRGGVKVVQPASPAPLAGVSRWPAETLDQASNAEYVVPDQSRAREMSYEHRAVEFFDEDLPHTAEKLDELSREGWELVCMESMPLPFHRIAWLRRLRS